MGKIIGLLIAFSVLTPGAALAQAAAPALQPSSGANTQDRLEQLAEILGALQYMRTLCAPTDGEFWRDRMQEMIRLEKPSLEEKNQLIDRFNTGYHDASGRFTMCTAEARNFASTTARQGETVAQSLSNAIVLSTN